MDFCGCGFKKACTLFTLPPNPGAVWHGCVNQLPCAKPAPARHDKERWASTDMIQCECIPNIGSLLLWLHK